MSSDAASDGVMMRAPAATAAALKLESGLKLGLVGAFFGGARDFAVGPGSAKGAGFVPAEHCRGCA